MHLWLMVCVMHKHLEAAEEILYVLSFLFFVFLKGNYLINLCINKYNGMGCLCSVGIQFILSYTLMKRIWAVFTLSGVSDKEIARLQQWGHSTLRRVAQSHDYL